MYFAMMRSTKPGRWMADWPYVEGLHWKRGTVITVAVPDPLEMELSPLNPDASDHDPNMPALLETDGPVFRDDLVDAMRAFGVTNLQTFNVAITDPDDGRVHRNYKAVNIIGLIAAADMAKSQATVHPGGPALIDVDFDRLVVDEKKTYDQLIFRLAESTNAVLVHQRLRDFLISKNFDDLVFHDTTEVAF